MLAIQHGKWTCKRRRGLNAAAAAIKGGRAFTFTPRPRYADMLAIGQNTMPRLRTGQIVRTE